MFLSYLNEDEKKAFLKLAKEFVMVDGEYSPEEEDLLREFAEEMNIRTDLAPILELGDIERQELFDAFGSRRSQISAVLELIGMGYADGEYCSNERSFIRQMADTFELSNEDLDRFEDWVLRQLHLFQEATTFWDFDAEEVVEEVVEDA